MKKLLVMLAVVLLVGGFAGSQIFAAEPTEKGQTQTYEQGTKGQQMSTAERGRMESWRLSRASELIGSSVKDEKGESLGKIEDIVINRNGQAQYLILSHGGILGIGEKLIPIPYQTAKWNAKDRTITLANVDKERLEKAPNFSDQEWNRLGESDYDKSVYGYYRCEPLGTQEPQRK